MIQSSGFIILDEKDKKTVALCVLSGFRQWDFPKGHQEVGESLLETAHRETEEETGLTQKDYQVTGEQAPSIIYKAGKDKKTATYFIGKKCSDASPFLPISPELGYPENIAWEWVPIMMLNGKMPKRFFPIVQFLENRYGSGSQE